MVTANHKSELDTKLEELLRPYDLSKDGLPAFGDLRTTSEKLIDDIKQAFKDAGYNNMPRITEATLYPVILKKVNGWMTGQEWYERFKSELMAIPMLWLKNDIPKQLSPYGLKCLEAAKRASGVE